MSPRTYATREMKCLLISSSTDETSQLFVARHGPVCQRIDADIDSITDVCLSSEQIGSLAISSDISAIYWRKPFAPEDASGEAASNFERANRKYLLKSFCRIAARKGCWMLVDPDYESWVPRPVQLVEAATYFQVPHWTIGSGANICLDRPRVVKSLVPLPVDGRSFLSTQRIPPNSNLAPEYTWYVQDCVEASSDITVLYCCGKQWAYELDRSRLGDQVDWRLFGDNHRSTSWKHIQLNIAEHEAIHSYMQTLPLNFGRLDFLRDRNGVLWFLEVNPNGQFAWLDPDDKLGMLGWIFDCAIAPPLGWNRTNRR